MTPAEFRKKLSEYHVRAAKDDGEYILMRSLRGQIMIVSDSGGYEVIEGLDGPTLASGQAAAIKTFLVGIYDLPVVMDGDEQSRPAWIIESKYEGGSLFTVVDEERSHFPHECNYPSVKEGGAVPGNYYVSDLKSRRLALDFIDAFGFVHAGDHIIKGI